MSMPKIKIRTINRILVVVILALGVAAVTMAYKASTRLKTLPPPLVQDAPVVRAEKPVKPAEPETPRLVFRDWHYECEGESACYAYQYVEKEEGIVILGAELVLSERAEQGVVPRLKMISPLGVFLPSGLQVALPEKDPFIVPFQFCTYEGCFVNLDMADDVIDALKSAQELKISYRNPDRKIQEVSLSLMGITKAIDQLKKDRKRIVSE